MNEKQRSAWVINGLLSVILVLLLGLYLNLGSGAAHAAGEGWGTDNIIAMSTAGPNERLVVVDTAKQNIMIYKTLGTGQFRLVGARSFQYDVEFEDTAESPIEKGNGATYMEVYRYYQDMQKRK